VKNKSKLAGEHDGITQHSYISFSSYAQNLDIHMAFC